MIAPVFFVLNLNSAPFRVFSLMPFTYESLHTWCRTYMALLFYRANSPLLSLSLSFLPSPTNMQTFIPTAWLSAFSRLQNHRPKTVKLRPGYSKKRNPCKKCNWNALWIFVGSLQFQRFFFSGLAALSKRFLCSIAQQDIFHMTMSQGAGWRTLHVFCCCSDCRMMATCGNMPKIQKGLRNFLKMTVKHDSKGTQEFESSQDDCQARFKRDSGIRINDCQTWFKRDSGIRIFSRWLSSTIQKGLRNSNLLKMTVKHDSKGTQEFESMTVKHDSKGT